MLSELMLVQDILIATNRDRSSPAHVVAVVRCPHTVKVGTLPYLTLPLEARKLHHHCLDPLNCKQCCYYHTERPFKEIFRDEPYKPQANPDRVLLLLAIVAEVMHLRER